MPSSSEQLSALLQDPLLSPSARVVASWIAARQADDGFVEAPYQHLREALGGRSEKTVQRTMLELLQSGWLERKSGGRGHADRFRLSDRRSDSQSDSQSRRDRLNRIDGHLRPPKALAGHLRPPKPDSQSPVTVYPRKHPLSVGVEVEVQGELLDVPVVEVQKVNVNGNSTRGRRRPKGRWTFVPEDWTPHDGHHKLCRKLGVDLTKQEALFRLHEFKSPKSDADRCFFTWIHRAAEYGEGDGNGKQKPGPRHIVTDNGMRILR